MEDLTEHLRNNLSGDIAALAKVDRSIGTPHIKQGVLSGYWLFNKSGRYGATVARNGKKCRDLKIVIFDCFQKEAFDYLAETTDLLSYEPSLYCFELNHIQRNARLIHIRNNFANTFSDRTYDVSVRPAYSVILKNKDYIPLFGGACLYLLPADPFSNIPRKGYFIDSPFAGEWDMVHGKFGMYKHMLVPIANAASVYMFKTFEMQRGKIFYRIDRLIRIDLQELAEGNKEGAYSEVALLIDYSHLDHRYFHTGDVVIGSQMNSDSGHLVCTVYLFDNINNTCKSAFMLELEQKRLSRIPSTINWYDKIMTLYVNLSRAPFLFTYAVYKDGTRLPISTLHSCGQLVQISYGNSNRKMFLRNLGNSSVSVIHSLQNITKNFVLLKMTPSETNVRNFSSALDRIL